MDGRSTVFVGLHVLMLITWIAPIFSQPQPKPFLSIDCGSTSNYIDSTTGIRWETDAEYISTGKNAQTFPSNYLNIADRRQVETLRYFDEGRSRDCYVLPVNPQTTYLVRPNFYYGNWRNDGGPWPSNFDVYLNATRWFSNSDAQDITPLEAVVYSTGNELNFCLVRVLQSGGPSYIASLELRELAPNMYSEVAASNQFLYLFTRQNCGASTDTNLRYPDDLYDRIWQGSGTYPNATSISGTNISSVDSDAQNQPPTKVMETAWVYYSSQRSKFTAYEQQISDPKFIMYGYFEELDQNASLFNVRGMQYIYNGQRLDTFNSSDQPRQRSTTILPVIGGLMEITLAQASWSKLNPMANAFEIYFVRNINTSTTLSEDLNSVMDLQRRINLTDWSGDPCLPVPYDWLKCNFSPGVKLNIARVTQLSLENNSLTGTIPPEITNLTALTYLNLSENRLTTYPTNLNLLNSLTVLDVSNNLLGGNIADFLETLNLGALREINAADNRFEGQFPIDSLLTNVETANFDRNLGISGTLDLREWLKSTIQDGPPSRLQLLSLVDNNITDIYPNLKALLPSIEALLPSKNGSSQGSRILLGGNPFCKKSTSTSLAQQYLCSSHDDALNGTSYASSRRTTIAIAIGTSAGAFFILVLVSTLCFATAWKLRKQTFALREIQEAFTKQKVRPPFYSYHDLRQATDNFSQHNKLGQGSFGAVYKGIMADGTILAIKMLFPPKHAKQAKQAFSDFLNEVVLITGIRHKNLLQLTGCCVKEDQRFLVYEYAENGNLAEALWGKSTYTSEKSNKGEKQDQGIKLDWEKRVNICVGVARGLSYLHEALQPKIIHRDIKSANILLNKNFEAKIADFGLARSFLDEQDHADYTQTAGTLGYVAPEYATRGELTEKADVYSFGVLVLEIVSGRKCIDRTLPFQETFLLNFATYLQSEGRELDLLEPSIQESANHEEVIRVIHIALLCLQMDSTKRPTMGYVVTMLSRSSMNVALSSEIPVYYQSDSDRFDLSVISENASDLDKFKLTSTTIERHPLMNPNQTGRKTW